jgi:hypothetical protein
MLRDITLPEYFAAALVNDSFCRSIASLEGG